MAEQPNISPTAGRLALPLDQLLDELVYAGFARDRVGVPLQLRLTDLLNHLTADTLTEQLKYKISALICHSAEEQEKFYAVFDSFAERFRAQEIADIITPPEKKEITPHEPPESPKQEHKPATPAPKETPAGSHKTDSVKAARSGPITVELHFRDDGYRPWNLPELESVVRPMREKEWTGAEEWDIPNTIRKTILAGGAPHFARRRRRKAPQYLFLIEQKSARDHLAGFYADLVAELSRRDLDAEFYYYDRIPRQCWKDRRDPSTYTTIDRLNAIYQQSRLILIGEPDGLLAVTSEPRDTKAQLVTKIHLYPSPLAFQLREEWPAVALLNTRSTALWGDVETAMHQLFPIAPANVAGLGSLMEQWKNRISYQPYFWKLQNPEPIPPTFRSHDDAPETVQQDIKNLKVYLGRQGYTWLCAIAVYPEIYWQLTKILHDEAISKEDVPDESLRTSLWHLYLLRLSRIPWLRHGHIPPDYRRELRKGLPAANAAEVRRQLLEVLHLDENKPPEGSYAEKDRVYTVALFEHERYVTLENPDDVRLTAMQEKLRQTVDAAGVAASDIEDAVGRSLFRNLPEMPAETVKNFWVLWVDDSPKNNQSFQDDIARDVAIRFVNVLSTLDAVKTLERQSFDLIISDVSRFGDKEAGIKMMRRFKEIGVTAPVYFFTHPNYVTQHREELMGMGAIAVVTGFKELKPGLLEAVKAKAEANNENLFKINFLSRLLQASKAVCRVVMAGDRGFGTGFLTAGNYLYTCNHVIGSPEIARGAHIEFNFEKDLSGETKPPVSYQLATDDFITSSTNQLNFTRLKVIDREDAPLSQWGVIELETSAIPAEKDQVSIIHHQQIDAKQAVSEAVVGVDGNTLYYGEDSLKMPGRSGAPVLNQQLKVVAIHQAFQDKKMILGKERTCLSGTLIRDIAAFIQKNTGSATEDTDDRLVKTADDLFEKGQEAYKNKDYPAAENHLLRAVEFYTKAGNDAGRANTQHELGKVHTTTGRLEEAKKSLDAALLTYIKLGFEAAQAFVLMDLGRVEMQSARIIGKWDQPLNIGIETIALSAALKAAEGHYEEAQDLLEGLNSDADKDIIECMQQLGAIAQLQGDLNKAKQRYLSALKLSRTAGLKAQELDSLMQLGQVNLNAQDANQALGCFSDALTLAENEADRARILEGLAEAEVLDEQREKALKHLNDALSIYTNAKDLDATARVANKLKLLAEHELNKNNTGDTPQPNQQNAPADPPLQSLFEPDKIKLFLLFAPKDEEYGEGLTRHLKRSEMADRFSLFDYRQTPPGEGGTRQTRYEMEQALQGRPKAAQTDVARRAKFEMEQADYVFVFVSANLLNDSDWFGMTYDALGLAKKVIPIMIEQVDLEGTGLEKLESLPRSSKNKTIRQFEDREDAYLVIRREVEEIVGGAIPEPAQLNRNQLFDMIAKGQLEAALTSLQDASKGLKNREFQNEISMHQGAYNDLTKSWNLAIITQTEFVKQQNRIARALIEVSTDVLDDLDRQPSLLPSKESLLDMLKEARLEEALNLLRAGLNRNYEGDAVMLLFQYSILNNEMTLGTISSNDYDVRKNQLLTHTLELLNTTLGETKAGNIAGEMSRQQEIKQLIAADKLKEALNKLRSTFPDADPVVLVMGRLALLERQNRQNLMDPATWENDMNRIRKEILELTDALFDPSSALSSGYALIHVPDFLSLESMTNFFITIRIGKNETGLLEGLDLGNVRGYQPGKPTPLTITEIMDVTPSEHSDNIEVEQIVASRQPILDTGFSEWKFKITNITSGTLQAENVDVSINITQLDTNQKPLKTFINKINITTNNFTPDQAPEKKAKTKIQKAPQKKTKK